MKKNILLILMFITMFFIGENEVEALVCEVGNSDCTIEAIQKDIGNENQLACVYQVNFEWLVDTYKTETKIYYNYIYYNTQKEEYYAGSTKSDKNKAIKPFKNANSYALITDDSLNSLKSNNKCPQYSYFEKDTSNQICFDSDNDNQSCKNNGNALDGTTDFNTTLNRTGILDTSVELEGFKYEKLLSNYTNITKKDIPSEYDNICTYRAYNGNFIHLLYNNSTNKLIYRKMDEKPERKMIINKGASKDFSDSGVSAYEAYFNKIDSVNECPETIYAKYYHEITDAERKSTTFYQTKPTVLDGEKNYTTIINFDLYTGNNGSGEELEPIEDCEDLIDTNSGLAKILKTITQAISIAIPILLIGLVTYDFATAVFAGDEKAVSKAKTNAIKRIIIAVVIFFVPTVLNLIFNLVNDVWGTNMDTCIYDNNN